MPTTGPEEALFAAALEKPTRAERAAFLDGACGSDLALRARLELLLASHDASGGALDIPPEALTPTSAFRPLTEGPGTAIGRYKLLQQIGEGGMGVVYMAEQQEPVRRKVALKIIKPGMDSAQVIARFEAERQALAMMDHQNIARVLDAGTTESGRPYFVMELVHGAPITRFCDDNKLTPRERLALFVPVCQAIQHAHQKGIIHRDIKPSNVLVTMYDDRPVPKVIDFGVAKATEQRLVEKTLFTQFGAMVGTLEYMSPEQAEMNALGVDTRSDIYSLGVLLYELLTGTTPLERTQLRAAALGELVRLIKEEEAPRPSVRLSSSDNLPKIAAARKTEPAQLSKLVRGEIDWIVMKCLEKDRSRRYDSASGLARDVERHLADEPVEACPPSTSYRLRKFARKHSKALATAAAFAVLLVAGAVISTLLAVWATSAERDANRQRIVSEAAKQEALEAKAEADRQRDDARRTAYVAALGLAQRAWDESNIPRARELLQEGAGENLRGWEWHYLSRQCRAELRTLDGHAGPVLGVAFSPDGQRVASGSQDHTVRIWDCTAGKGLLSLRGHGRPVLSVAFSPDGRRLASGSEDRTVKVWDSLTGNEMLTLKGHDNFVTGVAFSPDGMRLASSSTDQTAKVWDGTSGKELLSLKGHTDAVQGVAFSPDGQRLATASADWTAKVWDGKTGKVLHTLDGHSEAVTSVAFSPDSRRLASASVDQTVKVWNSRTGEELLSLGGPANWVMSVAFSPDGTRLAAGSFDWTVRVWDSSTGEERSTFKGHAEGVSSVAFSPDGQRLVSGGHDRTVKLWDSAPGQVFFSLKGHTSEVTGVAFSPDGRRLASSSEDRTVKVWDGTSGKELHTLKGHAERVSGIAFSPDGRRLASGSDDSTVKVWDSTTGKELFTLPGHAGEVKGVAFSPDGQRLASSSADQTIKLWDATAGKELLTLRGHAGPINSVAFSPDGSRLASGSTDGTVKVWDAVAGTERLSLRGHGRTVLNVAFSPDGQRLASGSEDRTAKVWDLATGKELVSLKGHNSAVTCVVFSPDGRRLASGSWTIKVWDSATGKELLVLDARHDTVLGVAFSPDGQRLATGNLDGTVNIWETSISLEVQDRRAARVLVADLFRQKSKRADVLEWLRAVPGLSPARRQEALAIAQTYPEKPAGPAKPAARGK